jgi:hypothetical protein
MNRETYGCFGCIDSEFNPVSYDDGILNGLVESASPLGIIVLAGVVSIIAVSLLRNAKFMKKLIGRH